MNHGKVKSRPIRKALKENGYTLDRKAKHEIWTKCGHEIAISYGKTMSSSMAAQVRAAIRNPVYKSEAYNG